MGYRIRHCVECPKCRVCYVIGRSPYANGSSLIPTVAGSSEEYVLYCSCSPMPIRTLWRWKDVKNYAISRAAYDRGFGTPNEVFPMHTQVSWIRMDR